MALREPAYKRNIYILKELGTRLKLVHMSSVRNAGVEVPKKERDTSSDSDLPFHAIHDERMKESISRSKRMIREYTLCNTWDFFFTGTLDKTKFNRYDLKGFHMTFSQWLRNYNRLNHCKITWLFVPELHEDGAVHIHGFISGIPIKNLHQFVVGDKMGKTIAAKVKKGETVYNWPAYANKFGFCDLESIKDKDSVSKYIQKYITEDLARAVESQDQCFWHSRGLKAAEIIATGTITGDLPFDFDYIGDYASVVEFENNQINIDSLLALFDDEARIKKEFREANNEGY